MKLWSEQVAGMGRERQKNFLEYCQRMIRENFIFNLHQRDLTYMTINEQNFASRFAPFVNERNVMGIMDTYRTKYKCQDGILRLLTEDDRTVEAIINI